MAQTQSILDRVRALLLGEPVRAISYGAIFVVWLVAYVSGHAVSVDASTGAVAAAIAIVTEFSRRHVSPAG